MGWDAYAIRDGKGITGKVTCEACGHSEHKVIDLVLRAEFERASQRVKDQNGLVDGFLSEGSLDLHESGQALEQATGMSVYVGEWSVEQTAAAWVRADWNRVQTRIFARESARVFLELCYLHMLGIRFSY